jgi:hypothetical protein
MGKENRFCRRVVSSFRDAEFVGKDDAALGKDVTD